MQPSLLLDYRYRESWSCSVMDDERASSVGAVEPRGDRCMYRETQDGQGRAGTSQVADVVTLLAEELDRDERLFVILRYAEGLEIGEIAAAMRCDEDSVQAGLARVQVRIQELLAVRSEELAPVAP